MSNKTSISLETYYEQFVQNLLSEGRYKNPSEVVQAGLRLLEEEENKRTALKAAMEQGVDSGLADEFDPEANLKALKKKKGTNA